MSRRLEMDLEVGTRFRLFGYSRPEQMFEVVGVLPDGRMWLRQVDGTRWGRRAEVRRFVERWVLQELSRGGWPWPPYVRPDEGETVYGWGQAEPAGYLPSDIEVAGQQAAARLLRLEEGSMFRWPDVLDGGR